MRTRRKKSTDAQDYSEKEWNFRFGPIRVGGSHSLASLSSHWSEIQAVLFGYIVDAMRDNRLPESAVLAQFILVPPHQDHLAINLKVPAVVRTSIPNWEACIRGFSIPAHFARSTEGFSFHNRAAEELLDTPAGTILVFAPEQQPPAKHIFGGVNLIWVTMPKGVATFAPTDDICIDDAIAERLPSDLVSVDIGKVIEDRRNQTSLTLRDSTKLSAHVKTFAQVSLTPVEQKQLHKFAVSLLGASDGPVAFNHYLSHVAASVSCGPVVLAQPKKIFFENRHTQNRLIDNSGISVQFRANTKLHYEELEATFRIAHRLSTTFTNLFGLAQAIALSERGEGAMETFRMVRHSIGNAIYWLPSTELKTKSILHLERFVIVAAAILNGASAVDFSENRALWREAGIEYESGKPESLTTTLKRSVERDNRRLELDCECLENLRTDPRLVALLVELSRNAVDHSPSGKASLTVFTGAVAGAVNIAIRSDCDYTTYYGLYKTGEQFVAGNGFEKGSLFSLRLAQALSRAHMQVCFRVGERPKQNANLKTWESTNGDVLSLEMGDPAVAESYELDDVNATFPFDGKISDLLLQ